MAKHARFPSAKKGRPKNSPLVAPLASKKIPPQQLKVNITTELPDVGGLPRYLRRAELSAGVGVISDTVYTTFDPEELEDLVNGIEEMRTGATNEVSHLQSFSELVTKFANRNVAIEAIRKGLPASVLKSASEYFEVPLTKIRAIVRLPESTAARLVQRQAEVDSSVSERIWRLADVMRMAIDVFEDESAAKSWLRSPNRTFNNSAPMDYLDTEPGAMSVRQVLNAIATGGAA